MNTADSQAAKLSENDSPPHNEGARSDAARAALEGALSATAAQVEAALDALLPRPAGLHGRAQEAMRYAIFAGGKRLRPFLVLQSAGLFGVAPGHAMRVAAAIEALHTYSLVHDDLPAMDDDDLRRGKPTAHKQFDEATAILAGDGLLTLAFELLADPATHPSGDIRAELVASLARAAGSDGMIGGQMIDIEAPNHQLGAAQIIELQQKKTGALFEFSCAAGAILGGAGASDRAALHAYARDFGLAFQICDDLIDVLGSAETAGKQVGKDAAQGKATLVSIWGVEHARSEAERLAEQASSALAPYGQAAHLLRALPFFLLDRRS
ncbi:polyprenyl synthetase family protein [Phenylobacterium sp.]|uniref:polyprenyl synthetase family protein n=1 Tax=Phenylobacterium sp. TaxID=1871053 RepID=UPI001222BA0A|nr:farnesyl diphosphate synthase [Phenylobacterium sp.]THD61312.1 MAG: polyprenyl synthetase family protein [Phenylobacterium sp.]